MRPLGALLIGAALSISAQAVSFQINKALSGSGRRRRGKQLRAQLSSVTSASGACSSHSTHHFSGTRSSLAGHRLPGWYRGSKLGIFIHWGLFSVPAFASTKYYFGDKKGVDQKDYLRNKPYAEWYMDSMLVPGSSTAIEHKRRYGEEPTAESYFRLFMPKFNQESKKWDPQKWADLFRAAGAGYVVLVTKHHDSFCLWPSSVENPNRGPSEQHAERDIVGDLTAAVRGAGLEMGLYYSGGNDWSFDMDFMGCNKNETYEELAYAHLKELIHRYSPSLLWNDIGWPGVGKDKERRLDKVFADYLSDSCPGGVINDRWGPLDDGAYNGDFSTPEYKNIDHVYEEPFELCRGMGHSFGYNAEEGLEDYLTPEDAVWLLADVTAKNGNLLLNVGPRADGSIHEGQMRVLNGLASWMAVNEEAIYGTTPYLAPGSSVSKAVRYTKSKDAVYAITRAKDVRNNRITLDRDELNTPTLKAEFLAPGGAKWVEFVGGSWQLPQSAREDITSMPVVLRFPHVH